MKMDKGHRADEKYNKMNPELTLLIWSPAHTSKSGGWYYSISSKNIAIVVMGDEFIFTLTQIY